ncbi:hypothetical protein K1719_032741 [Acacia pycnantha]|nr:hypothetical protein K1719_032741 [Acacia pycnantha]
MVIQEPPEQPPKRKIDPKATRRKEKEKVVVAASKKKKNATVASSKFKVKLKDEYNLDLSPWLKSFENLLAIGTSYSPTIVKTFYFNMTIANHLDDNGDLVEERIVTYVRVKGISQSRANEAQSSLAPAQSSQPPQPPPSTLGATIKAIVEKAISESVGPLHTTLIAQYHQLTETLETEIGKLVSEVTKSYDKMVECQEGQARTLEELSEKVENL